MLHFQSTESRDSGKTFLMSGTASGFSRGRRESLKHAVSPQQVLRSFMSLSFVQATACLAVALIFSGCQTVAKEAKVETRHWSGSYKEVVNIATEPPGCRIYVQETLKGTSPLKTTIDCGELMFSQSGTYQQKVAYKQGFWSGKTVGSKPLNRIGGTDWNGPVTFTLSEGSYTIQAIGDGYSPAERTVTVGPTSDAVRQAAGNARPDAQGNLNANITGTRNVLLILNPISAGYTNTQVTYPGSTTLTSSTPSPLPPPPPAGYPVPDNSQRTAELAAARQEYEAAQAAYNKALADLEGAQVLAGINDTFRQPIDPNDPVSRAVGAIDIVNKGIIEPVQFADLKLKVQQAEARLRRAEQRVSTAEWKQ